MVISKSKYMRGCQCSKALWLSVNKPELADEIQTISTQQGDEVGECARTYFPDAITIPLDRTVEMTNQTMAAIQTGRRHICEATFMGDGLSCSCDIVVMHDKKSLDIIEVKSSMSIKDRQLDDVCFQAYVVTQAGYDVQNVFLMHPTQGYAYVDSFDVHAFFTLENVTDIIKNKMPMIKDNILTFTEICSDQEPSCDIGMHCEKPYECPFKEYCHQLHNIPEKSVFDIPGMAASKKYSLYKAGMVSVEDLSNSGDALTDKQKELVKDLSLMPGESIIRKAELEKFLGALHYPMYYLDFESFQKAIPPFPQTHPYSQIPFQYSLHIQQYAVGPVEHREFLAEAGKDPRRYLAEQLVRDIPMGAHAIAYNSSFEKTVCRKLAERFPDLKEGLHSIANNMDDLLIPFKNKWVYTSSMRGSCSIKAVLPALCGDDPSLDYHSLPGVQNGAQASETYGNLQFVEDAAEVQKIRDGLLLYCGLDTLAMVKVLEKLYSYIRK